MYPKAGKERYGQERTGQRQGGRSARARTKLEAPQVLARWLWELVHPCRGDWGSRCASLDGSWHQSQKLACHQLNLLRHERTKQGFIKGFIRRSECDATLDLWNNHQHIQRIRAGAAQPKVGASSIVQRAMARPNAESWLTGWRPSYACLQT